MKTPKALIRKSLTDLLKGRYPSNETVAQTIKEYGRGLVGGLIFSLPILYTMEVWWSGFIASPAYLITAVIITYALLFGYNRFAGMHESFSWLDIAKDSVEELALGFTSSFVLLLALDRVDFDMPMGEIVGKTIVESIAVSIGFSVGSSQLGQNNETGTGKKGDEKEQKRSTREDESNAELIRSSVLAICGAFLFASSVAPTEEILVIAITSKPAHILSIALGSILLCATVLFFTNFRGTAVDRAPLRKMVLLVSLSYSIALLTSLGFLWFFDRIEGLYITLAETVVLALPAVLGASAGRLLIQITNG